MSDLAILLRPLAGQPAQKGVDLVLPERTRVVAELGRKGIVDENLAWGSEHDVLLHK